MSDRFKKLLLTGAAITGLAAGGAAFANAQGGTPTPTPSATQQSQTTDTPEPGDKLDANEQGETKDGNGQGEKADQVAGADAQKAKDAALAATGGGKVNEVSAEQQDGETNDDQGKADTPEPGDTPDPAYESQIAYDVEVAKTDGTVVDVHLDKAFKVLGTEKADAEHGHQD